MEMSEDSAVTKRAAAEAMEDYTVDEKLRKTILEKIDKDSVLNAKEIGTDYSYKHKMVWMNAFAFLVLHVWALMGLFVVLTGRLSLQAIIWNLIYIYIAIEGITIGAHRYYTHRSFKAKPILQACFLLGHTIAGQNSMFTWSRDHRLHHRYSDTDADPHNSKRGFFFSHIGWLMMRKHPYVSELGRRIDLSDLLNDKMVMLQKKYYYVLYALLAVLIPVWVPVQFFGDSWINSFLVSYALRYTLVLHGTWLVNSAAHLYGTRPYDQNLQSVESWCVSAISLGEGWHNYHHAFPWDYKTAELSELFNLSADVIKFLEKIGLAYDLKTASPEMIRNRIKKFGDGTHYELGNDEAKSRVTAWGPLHPLNPTYNTTYKAPDAILKQEGLPLFDENDVFDIQNSTLSKPTNNLIKKIYNTVAF